MESAGRMGVPVLSASEWVSCHIWKVNDPVVRRMGVPVLSTGE